MLRIRNFLPLIGAALVGAAVLGASAPARADFILRATDVLGPGSGSTVTDFFSTGLLASAADGSGAAVLNHVVGNFSITLVTHISTTGPGFTSDSDTINITYNGPAGANSDKLIVEVLANKFSNPTAPALASISSNGSPSTSGLAATSVVMTSGVILGNITALNVATVGSPAPALLGGQLGTTTGSGSMGNASSVLNPNPVGGASFNLSSTPFSF